MTTAFTGRCLCGAVRYASSAAPFFAGHCQCSDCRRTSATGHASNMAVSADAVTITGEVKVYSSKADAGHEMMRGFCPTCGSPIYVRNSQAAQFVILHPGTLDDPEIFKPQMVIYAGSAASWDHMDPSLPRFPAMPPRPST